MITSRSISREVNESIPLPYAMLEIVLEDDVAVPPTLFDNEIVLTHAIYLKFKTFLCSIVIIRYLCE